MDHRPKERIQHIVSANQFHRDFLEYFFNLTDDMKQFVLAQERVGMGVWADEDEEILNRYEDALKHKVAVQIFYEPSTRTECSFDLAAKRLGMQVYHSYDPNHFSSKVKHESFEDTIIVLSEYADAIIIRGDHVGMALEAAHVSRAPILNAGDGKGEHPTQTLLDLYTLREHREEGIDGITLALVGDLKYGRTVRSLARAMRCYETVKLFLVAPDVIQMEQDVLDDLDTAGINYDLVDNLDGILPDCDAVYMTRAQLERHQDTQIIKKLDLDPFTMTAERAERMPEHGIIMHPLPRVGEIKKDVDLNPRAKYFHPQVRNGMLTRMAELYHCVLATYQRESDGAFTLDEKLLLKKVT